MSDGIHHSQKASEEAKEQSAIAQEILSYLEDPTPTSMTVLKEIVTGMQGNVGWLPIYKIVLRLDGNDAEEWQRFHNSSAFASQNDDFKNRFLLNAKKRIITGF